jgi:SAM-dependent MidA family methyltransferase
MFAYYKGDFLGQMGLAERIKHITKLLNDEDTKKLIDSTERVAGGVMGTKFKALAITHPLLKVHGFDRLA